MKRNYTYHGITVQYGEPGNEELTACFGPDDFERWFLEGGDHSVRFEDSFRDQLFENCLYLTDAEQRVLAQTPSELRDAIDKWAGRWNDRITEAADADRS